MATKNGSLRWPRLTQLLLHTARNYLHVYSHAQSDAVGIPDSRVKFYRQYLREANARKRVLEKRLKLTVAKKKRLNPEVHLRHPFAQDIYGQSELHYTVGKRKGDIVRKLLELRFDPNLRDAVGRTPFMISCEMGNLEMAKLLYEFGAAVNSHDFLFGFTPLISAVALNNVELARFLIACGANVDIPDFVGETPTIHAVVRDHVACVELLIKSNANLERKSISHETPLSIAQRCKFEEIARLLLDAGPKS